MRTPICRGVKSDKNDLSREQLTVLGLGLLMVIQC